MADFFTLLQPKFKATALHLVLTAIFVSFVVGGMILFMYPGPFFEMEGGTEVLKILVLVDLVIGPFLTFIVFKPNKASLKFDLSAIVVFQLAFLIYGVSVITSARPAFLVFSKDRYVVVSAGEVEESKIQYPELLPLSYNGPKLVGVLVTDPKLSSQILSEVLQGEKDVEFRPEFYQPYINFSELVKERLKSLNNKKLSDEHRRKLEDLISAEGVAWEDLGYLPVVGKMKDKAAIVRRDTTEIIGYLDIDPWKE